MRRILSIWLPRFAMERFMAAARRRAVLDDGAVPDARRPMALIEAGAKGVRITAVNEAALDQSVAADQMLTDARAVCPGLAVYPADFEADGEALTRLGRWAGRYGPVVAVDGADGLLLDIAGSAHLFGGEARLMADVEKRLERMGFTARTALAETIGAAHGIARFAPSHSLRDRIVEPGSGAGATADLPAASLRLAPDTVLLLRRLGLKTVGALAAVPRPALERRFRSKQRAEAVQLRLDQMSGARVEPIQPLVPPVRHRAQIAFPDPALELTAVEQGLTRLLDALCASLEAAGSGARHLTLTACHADGGTSSVSVRLSRPGRAPGRIVRLFEGHLDRIDPGFGIDAMILAADVVEALQVDQDSLADDPRRDDKQTAHLVDRLVGRLGPRSVSRITARASHIPERAQVRVAANALPDWPHAAPQTAARPFRLLAHPETVTAIAEVPDGPPLRFVWRRVPRHVVRARGPERIAAEWWLGEGDEIRDYYEVEDEAGQRYWLYREGLYQDPARHGPPRWFVHGLFA